MCRSAASAAGASSAASAAASAGKSAAAAASAAAAGNSSAASSAASAAHQVGLTYKKNGVRLRVYLPLLALKLLTSFCILSATVTLNPC